MLSHDEVYGVPSPTREPHGASISRSVQLCFNGGIFRWLAIGRDRVEDASGY